MTNLAKIVAFLAALLTGSAGECFAADDRPELVVEIENPLASYPSAAGLT